MDRIVFVDVCYICGRKVYGRKSTFDKTWTSNFKGLTAHIKCLKKGGGKNDNKMGFNKKR